MSVATTPGWTACEIRKLPCRRASSPEKLRLASLAIPYRAYAPIPSSLTPSSVSGTPSAGAPRCAPDVGRTRARRPWRARRARAMEQPGRQVPVAEVVRLERALDAVAGELERVLRRDARVVDEEVDAVVRLRPLRQVGDELGHHREVVEVERLHHPKARVAPPALVDRRALVGVAAARDAAPPARSRAAPVARQQARGTPSSPSRSRRRAAAPEHTRARCWRPSGAIRPVRSGIRSSEKPCRVKIVPRLIPRALHHSGEPARVGCSARPTAICFARPAAEGARRGGGGGEARVGFAAIAGCRAGLLERAGGGDARLSRARRSDFGVALVASLRATRRRSAIGPRAHTSDLRNNLSATMHSSPASGSPLLLPRPPHRSRHSAPARAHARGVAARARGSPSQHSALQHGCSRPSGLLSQAWRASGRQYIETRRDRTTIAVHPQLTLRAVAAGNGRRPRRRRRSPSR